MLTRYRFIDYVKGIGIISVVLGHLFVLVMSSDPAWDLSLLIRFFSIYELAVFFVVSGFLIACKQPDSIRFQSFFQKKAKKFLPVYLFFSILYLFEHFSATNVLSMITGFGISVLWFLSTLFLAELLFLLQRKIGKIWIRSCISLSLVIVAFICGRMLFGSEGMWQNMWQSKWQSMGLLGEAAGYLLILILRSFAGQFFVGLGASLNRLITKGSVGLRIALTIVCLGTGTFCSFFIHTVDWRTMNFSEPFLWIIAASLMSSGILMGMHFLDRVSLRILEQIGRESMLIMCTHLEFNIIPICIALGRKAAALNDHLAGPVYWLVTVLSLAAVEAILILLKKGCIWIYNKMKTVLNKET